MVKDLMVEAISFKTRGIRAGGKWLEVPNDFDLKKITKGQIYTMEIVDTFDDKLKLIKIK